MFIRRVNSFGGSNSWRAKRKTKVETKFKSEDQKGLRNCGRSERLSDANSVPGQDRFALGMDKSTGKNLGTGRHALCYFTAMALVIVLWVCLSVIGCLALLRAAARRLD